MSQELLNLTEEKPAFKKYLCQKFLYSDIESDKYNLDKIRLKYSVKESIRNFNFNLTKNTMSFLAIFIIPIYCMFAFISFFVGSNGQDMSFKIGYEPTYLLIGSLIGGVIIDIIDSSYRERIRIKENKYLSTTLKDNYEFYILLELFSNDKLNTDEKEEVKKNYLIMKNDLKHKITKK